MTVILMNSFTFSFFEKYTDIIINFTKVTFLISWFLSFANQSLQRKCESDYKNI